MPFRIWLCLFLIALMCLTAISAQAKVSGDVVILRNGDLEVGLSREWGGAIYSLRWHGREYVDDNDCGRLIQAALFSHEDSAFNPTQGGAVHNQPGGCLVLKKLSPTTAYSRSRTLHWQPRKGEPRESTFMLEQWTTVAADHVEVRYRWTNTGPRVQGAINQESPVIYMLPNPPAGPGSFNFVHSYTGAQPWSADPDHLVHFDVTKRETDPNYKPFGYNFRATEYWLAMTDEHGDGLTLFDPEFTDAHARRSYGKAPKFKMLKAYELWGADDPLMRSVREADAWIYPGDWQAARTKVTQLWINRRDWDFQRDGASGWRTAPRETETNTGTVAKSSKDGLQVTPQGAESAGINIPAAAYSGIRLRYTSPHAQTLRVLFRHDQDLTWNNERSMQVRLEAGGPHELAIDLSRTPGWLGQIRNVRLEPDGPLTLASAALERRPTLRWDYNVRGENENWFPVRDGDLLTPESDGTALVGRAWFPGPHRYRQPYLLDAPSSSGTLPRMTCWPGLGLPAKDYPHLRLRMKTTGSSAPPRIYWQNTASSGFDRNYLASPGTALTASGPADAEGYSIYTANLAAQPDWNGTLEQLMLAPVEGLGSSFAIDWLELGPPPAKPGKP